jgi:hypothetical protein
MIAAAAVWLLASTILASDQDGFTNTFDVKPDQLASTGRSSHFILEPDYQLVYESTDNKKTVRLVVTVLPETETIDSFETRAVESVELLDDLPRRVTRQFLAIDKTTADIYLFGKTVEKYDGWRSAGKGMSWRAGQNGSRLGLLLPGNAQVGQKFYESMASRLSMDRAEVVSTSESIRVPASRFDRCVKIVETSPTSSKRKNERLYAPGVGLVVDGNFRLVRYGSKIMPRPDAKQLVANAKQRAKAAGELTEPIVPIDTARAALNGVGVDAEAERVWEQAINDPALSASQRSDLIEDLNENGFADPSNVQPEELPIVLNRLALIEELAPDAMDQVNADAFAEAYKDLTKIAKKLTK